MSCENRSGRDEFVYFDDNCNHNQSLILGFNLVTLIIWGIFTVLILVHFSINRFKLSVAAKNRHFGKAQNYSRGVMFVLLLLTSILFTAMSAVRYGYDETIADRGSAVNYLLAASLSSFWAATFAYRVSLAALYMMLDSYHTEVPLKLITILYAILWFAYSLCLFVLVGLNVTGDISGFHLQVGFYVSMLLIIVFSSPGWLWLPITLIRGIRARAFKAGGKLSENNQFLLKKLRGGMALQALAGIIVIILCILALSVPELVQYNTVFLHLIFLSGIFTGSMQFFIFGGLTKRYAHKAYMRDDADKSPSGQKGGSVNSTKESNSKAEETNSTGGHELSQSQNNTNSNKGDEVEIRASGDNLNKVDETTSIKNNQQQREQETEERPERSDNDSPSNV